MSNDMNFGIDSLRKEGEFRNSIDANKKAINEELKKMSGLAKSFKDASKAKDKAELLNDKKGTDKTEFMLAEKKNALNNAFISLSDSMIVQIIPRHHYITLIQNCP